MKRFTVPRPFRLSKPGYLGDTMEGFFYNISIMLKSFQECLDSRYMIYSRNSNIQYLVIHSKLYMFSYSHWCPIDIDLVQPFSYERLNNIMMSSRV